MQFRNLIFIALIGWGAHAAAGQSLQLIRVANVPGSYLGVAVQDVSAERAKALKLPEEAGVEVTLLDPMYPNNPAALAGIRVGDVVMQYNGQRVEDREQFLRMVRETPSGREVKLQIYRNGSAQTIVARLVPVPPYAIQGGVVPLSPHSQPFQGASPDVPLNRMSWGIGALGAELESLEGQLADSFGVKDGGVLVRSVMRGSAAEKAGLKAGDVITRVGEAKVTTPADVSGRIRAGRGQSVILTVWREHHEISLTIALDGNRPGEQ
jgi:serine protease Do